MQRYFTPIVFTALFVLMAVALITIGYSYAGRGNFTGVDTLSSLALIGVAAVYCLIVLAWRQAGMMEAVNAYFFLFPIGVVATYQSLAGIFPWLRSHSAQDMLDANLLAIAVIMLFAIGSIFGRNRPFTLPTIASGERQIAFSKFTFGLSFLLLTGANAWPRLLTPRYDKLSLTEGITDQIIFVAQDIALCAMVVLIVARKSSLHRQRVSNVLYYLAGSYTFLIFNPIGNIRSVFIGYALSCICALIGGWSMTSKGKGVFISLLCAGNFILFPAVKSLGSGLVEGSDAFVQTFQRFGLNLFTPDFDVPQMTANGMAYVARFGHTPLEYIAGFFLFPIPRSLWPDKPTGTPFYIMDSLNYTFLNLSYPYYLDLWSSGGYLLTALGVVLVGYFIMRLGESSRSAERNGTFCMSMVMYSLIAGFAPIMLRGSINGSVAFYGFAFYWVLVTMILANLLRKA